MATKKKAPYTATVVPFKEQQDSFILEMTSVDGNSIQVVMKEEDRSYRGRVSQAQYLFIFNALYEEIVHDIIEKAIKKYNKDIKLTVIKLSGDDLVIEY